MHNIIKALGLAVLLAASTAAQAELIGIEVGIAAWRASPSGWVESEKGSAFGKVDLESDLHLDDQTAGFTWVRLVHPIPLLPNLKVSYTPLKFEGSGQTSRNFSFGGTTIGVNEQVDSELQLNQWDATLFYNLLDNVVELDLGLNIKVLDGSVRATGQTSGTTNVDFTVPVPMLYLRGGVDLPFTDLYMGVEGSVLALDSHRIADAKASIRYTFAGVIGLEAGYRVIKLKLDDLADISADFEAAGPYLGVAARF
jgi:outer membrane protein